MRNKSSKIFIVVVFMVISFCLYSQYFPPPQNVQVNEHTGFVTWDPPANLFSQHSRELIGYNIYLDDMINPIAFTTALVYQLTDLVLLEEYITGVSAVYDEPGESEIIEVNFIYWNFPWQYLVAELFNYNDVHLVWIQPPTGGVLAHHSGYDFNGIGIGLTDLYCAARFDAEDLADYYGLNLNSVNVHIRSAYFTYVGIKVWEGGSMGNPGTEIYNEEITTSVLIEEWTNHVLTAPITLVEGNEYWLGYEIHMFGDHPCSIDAGPAVAGKGDWMFYQGIWQEISVAFGLDYNWCIEGVVGSIDNILCTKPTNKKRTNIKVKTHHFRNMVSNGTPEVLISHPPTKRIEKNRDNRLLLGYNVYRDNVVIAEIDDPNTLTYDDLALDGGTYEYWVTAIYDTGESDPTNIEEITVILYPPQNLIATMQGNYIFITWDPPGPLSGRDLDYYNIYLNGVFISSTSDTFILIPLPSSTFEFGVTAVYDGSWESTIASITIVVDVDDMPVPLVTELIGNYPNPFNPTTMISFSLNTENTEDTELVIYNMKGQKIKTLECNNHVIAEATESLHHITWNGRDENNQPVSSGIYFYQLKAGKDFSQTKRMLLLK